MRNEGQAPFIYELTFVRSSFGGYYIASSDARTKFYGSDKQRESSVSLLDSTHRLAANIRAS